MKRFYLLCFIYSFTMHTSCSQSSGITGVYAGIELTVSGFAGGGMDRNDIAIYLRGDGSFTDKLGEADWKTAKKGTYTISGKKVTFRFASGKKDKTYTLTSEGNLNAGSFVLFKMVEQNTIPPGLYKYNHTSGSGGIGTNVPYVGSSRNHSLYFDGKGNFTTNSSNTSMVAGDNMGGGSTKKSEGEGTYVLKQGVLTLRFNSGTISTHSCFARKSDKLEKTMAVIDGKFYFEREEKEKTTNKKTTTKRTTTKSDTLTNVALSGNEVLKKLRNEYGAEQIDQVKILHTTATHRGAIINSYIDIKKKYYRYEVMQAGKLLAVEQLEGDKGWQWVQGKTTPLSGQRIREIQLSLHLGIFGLGKYMNHAFATAQVVQEKNGYVVTLPIEGQQLRYHLDRQYKIIGESYTIGNASLQSTLSRFKKTDGLLLPYSSTISGNASGQLVYTVSSYVINPQLPASIWNPVAEK